MKKKMKNRLLTFVISLAMVFTTMPMMGSEAFGESEVNELECATTLNGDPIKCIVQDTKNALPDGTRLEVTSAEAGTDRFSELSGELDDDNNTEREAFFDVSLVVAEDNHLPMPLASRVKLLMQIPPGWDKNKLDVVLVASDRDTAFEENIITKDGVDYVAVDTDHFSPYAIIDKQGAETPGGMAGKGTKENPYQIKRYDELKEFARIVNGTHDTITQNAGACARVIASFKCTDEEWVPIGTKEQPYTGTFDGNDKVISKLSNKYCDKSDYQGLFGSVASGGTVKKVVLEDVYIHGFAIIGGLVGASAGTISNCKSSGLVTVSEQDVIEGNYYVGGVAGYNEGSINNCHNSGSVTVSVSSQDDYHVYGIAGVAGYNKGSMNNCHNSGSVTVNEHVEYENGYNSYYIKEVGGIAGYNEGSMNNCHNSGSITVKVHNKYSKEDDYDVDEIGGVIGEDHSNNNKIVTNCYNTGSVYVSGVGPDNIGGFVGQLKHTGGKEANCYNTGRVTVIELCEDDNYHTCEIGGFAGENIGTMTNCYNTGPVSVSVQEKSKADDIGGFSGDSDGLVTNCYNTGSVSVSGEPSYDVGGVIGENYGGIINCYNIGSVTVSEGSSHIGGVLGLNYTEYGATITNCYYDKELCAIDKAAGSSSEELKDVKGLTTKEMTGKGALSNMVFAFGNGESNPWMEKENDRVARYYPHLKGFNFDKNGRQQDAKDIPADKWPPKIDPLVAATPTFSPAAGNFGPKQNITISCKTGGATIYYTTDGKDPTTSGKKYTGPIAVTDTTTIKAIAVKDGMFDSDIAVADYTHVHKYGAWTKLDGKKHQRVCRHDAKHIEKGNHKWDAGKVTKKATEKETGIRTYTCTVCRATKSETIPKLTPAPAPKPEPAPTPRPTPKKIRGTTIAKIKAGKNNIIIGWNKIKGADGYDIFFARCNHSHKDTACRKVKNIKGNKIFKWKKSGLKNGKAYKAYLRAYIKKDGKKKYVSKSPVMHAYTGNGTKKYTNAKSVSIKNIKKGKLTLKNGKTFRIKARVNKVNKKKKLMPKSHAPTLRYMTSDKKIAIVTKKGKIIAKGKGKCYVYAYAHNGVYKKLKVAVKM